MLKSSVRTNKITNLTKKLDKRPLEACNKGSRSKESHKESNHNKYSNKEHKLKKDSSLRSLSIDQIQSLVADAVKF